MAIVAFPATPTVGDTHDPGNGTIYTYREPGGVGVWVNENTGASLVDNNDGTVTFNSGVTGAAAVTLDLPDLVADNITNAEGATLLEKAYDGVAVASAAEIAALSGDETVLVELDDGTLRQLAFDDFPGGGGVSTGPFASGAQIAYPVDGPFIERDSDFFGSRTVNLTKPADATHVAIQLHYDRDNSDGWSRSGGGCFPATGDVQITNTSNQIIARVNGVQVIRLDFFATSVTGQAAGVYPVIPHLDATSGAGLDFTGNIYDALKNSAPDQAAAIVCWCAV